MKAKKTGLSLKLDVAIYRDYDLNDPDAALADAVRKYTNNVKARGAKIFRHPVPDPQPTIHGTLDVIVRALLVGKGAMDVRKVKRLPSRTRKTAREQATQQYLFCDETRRR